MAKYLLMKVAAFNDPADQASDGYWGFDTHAVYEVNTLAEAIQMAKSDLETSARDRFDYDMEAEARKEKIKEFLTQDIETPFNYDNELDEYLKVNKIATVYNARYFDDDTGSEDINEYDVIRIGEAVPETSCVEPEEESEIYINLEEALDRYEAYAGEEDIKLAERLIKRSGENWTYRDYDDFGCACIKDHIMYTIGQYELYPEIDDTVYRKYLEARPEIVEALLDEDIHNIDDIITETNFEWYLTEKADRYLDFLDWLEQYEATKKDK